MAKRDPKTKMLPGPVLRTNRFFIQLKAYGQADENGRAVNSASGFNKMIAPADRPLIVIEAIMEAVSGAMRYSSRKAAQQDLKEFKQFVRGLKVK